MRNHIFAILLSAALCISFTACGAEKPQPSSEAPLTGGWTLTATETAVSLPEEAQDAFSKAAGDELIPVAMVGEQVVAGKNYMFLCAENGSYRIAVVYRDLQGNAELTNTADFNLLDYTQSENATPAELLPGSWYAPEEQTILPLPEDARQALNKAMDEFTGSSIEPMALLGTQVVAGTNYAILCRVTPVVPDAVSSIQVATVYADLQGGAEFTCFCHLDQAQYNT